MKMQFPSSCHRCKCHYELRNLTVMKVVVILVIWVIGLLVIYMAFLSCLEPVLARRKMLPSHAPSAAGYDEHHDEDDLEEDMQGKLCQQFGTTVLNNEEAWML